MRLRSPKLALIFLLELLAADGFAGSLQSVVDNCRIDWGRVEHKILSEPDENTYNTDPVSGLALDAGGAFFSALDSADRSKNCSALDSVRAATFALAKNRAMNSFQKACLVKCVASNYLEYTPSQIGTACAAAKVQKVNCKGYAALADYLLDQLKVPTHSVGALNSVIDAHAYNRIKAEDGRWYTFEPQDAECEFFM